MTLAYERATGPGWGTLIVGERRLPFHLVAIVLGTTVWLGAMLLKTGGGGVAALWTNLLFLAGLLLLASLTRTLSVRRVSTMFFAGGLMMGLMLVVSAVFAAVEPDPRAVTRALVLPPLEEVLKLAPVLFFLWRRRHGRLWALGATDLLLLAAASGAGFALVEDAYVRARFGWPDGLPGLQISAIYAERIVPGHAIDTGLAGATLGLGLLLRSRGRLALWVAGSGFALATLDHVANNLDAFTSGFVVSALNLLVVNGFLIAYLFLVAVAAVVAADLYVLHRTPPHFPSCPPPPRTPGLSGMLSAWEVRLDQRALTYATFQYRRATGANRREAGWMASAMARSLVAHHLTSASGEGGLPPSQSDDPGGSRPMRFPDDDTRSSEPSGLTLQSASVRGDVVSQPFAKPSLVLLMLLLMAVVAVLHVLGVLAGLAGLELLRDVGNNVDPSAGPSSLGGGPGAGDRGKQKGFRHTRNNTYTYEGPSLDSTPTGRPPEGGRYMYDDVTYGANGQPTFYHMHPPGSAPGWVPAANTTPNRPQNPHQGSPTHRPDTGIRNISMKGADGAARG